MKAARKCPACGETLTPFVRHDGHGHKQRGYACMTSGCKAGLWAPWAKLKEESDRIANATKTVIARRKDGQTEDNHTHPQ
jgi:hypothetical protein